ncbi:MAG TPA: hypothetical protein DCO79_09495 [Spirochaeta sp.]|nr:hypothetical protein [Spirochaeta sp.]
MKKKIRFAVMFGNRGFFPGELVASAREEMSKAIIDAGYEPVLMDSALTHFGAVETLEEAELFSAFVKKEAVDGLIICMPNFSDESAAARACHDLNIPIFIQAYPDVAGEMDFDHRRDAFCGKLSMMDVMCQYQIPFTIDSPHVIHPDNPGFTEQLHDFAGVCRVVSGMRRCTLGALGARTTPFKTVRYDEIALQKVGITVETFDLSEVIAKAKALDAGAPEVSKMIEQLKEFTDCSSAPQDSLIQMARLGVVIQEYIDVYKLDVVAIRCWSELEIQLGCAPCALIGLFGERGIPIACELDVCNAVIMHALALASDGPSTLMDWNNNYGDEPDSCIIFHCGPTPKSLLTDSGHMIEHPMFKKSFGPGCGWGPVEGRLKPGDITYASCKTEDGELVAYFGDAEIEDREVEKEFFGVYGVVTIENLQEKLLFFGRNAFRHHMGLSSGHVAKILREAFTTYLGYTCVNLP